jgi:hypothetical protein
MLKRAFTAVVAASILFAAAGCGPKDPGSSGSNGATTGEANTNKLVIWDKAIPAVLLYLAAQRFLISGLAEGGVK